jgi:chromosome segregation ATPase
MQSATDSLERDGSSFNGRLRLIESQHSTELLDKQEQIVSLQRQIADQNDERIRFASEILALEESIARSYVEIREQKRLCAEAQQEKAELADQLSKTSHTVDLLKLHKKQLRARIDELQSKQASVSKENDRDAAFHVVEQRFSQQVKLVSEELSEAKSEIDRLRLELTDAHNRNHELHLSVDDLVLRVQKGELAYQMLQRTYEREKQLMEGNLRHQAIIAENQLRTTVAELSYRIRESRREVIAVVALQFASFFDTENEIDESRLLSVLSEIRCKLLMCIGTGCKIRNLLQIGPTQSIEAEITQVLLK